MVVAALILSCVVFVEAFLFLELGKQARGILASARGALELLADAGRSDDEKELGARKAAGRILAMTAVLLLKLAAIAAALAVLLLGAVLLSPDSRSALAAALASPIVFVSLTLAAVGYLWMRNAILGQI